MARVPPQSAKETRPGAELRDQLIAWRERAGRRRGHSRAISRESLAALVKPAFSPRWYAELESGRGKTLPNRDRMTAVAKALGLSPSEQDTLFLLVGLRPVGVGNKDALKALRFLVNRFGDPALATDETWNLLAYNRAYAAWMPPVTHGPVNMAQFLLSADARQHFGERWEGKVRALVASLRFSRSQPGDGKQVDALVAGLRRDPTFRRLWETHTEVSDEPPAEPDTLYVDGRPVPAFTHVLRPVALPNVRLSIITPPPEA
jgi:hypothetical protein